MSGVNRDHVVDILPAFVNGTLDRISLQRADEHLDTCESCRTELQTWKAIGLATRALTARMPAPSPAILERVRIEINREREKAVRESFGERAILGASLRQPLGARVVARLSSARQRVSKPAWGALAAAVLIGVVVASPIGSGAASLITIFQPKQIAAVPITTAELQSLPNLNDYGTVTQPQLLQDSQQFTSVAAAGSAAGTHVLVPGALPSGIPTTATYRVVPGQTGSFTFSAAKAQASAAAKGKVLPAMPANIDGSSIEVTTSASVVTIYSKTQATTGDNSTSAPTLGPILVIAQSTTPEVKSSGVSATELENYLLEQPGISPQLTAEIRAIGDPSSTLPIPVPVDKATSHQVQVQGVTGVAMADSTGVGGGIVWQKDGSVYAVGGTLAEAQLVAVANSLH